MSEIYLIEAWIGAYELKCRNVQFQPPKLSHEFFKWASERNLTVEKPKLAVPMRNGFFLNRKPCLQESEILKVEVYL